MQYALLIYENLAAYEPLSREQGQALTAEYVKVGDDPRIRGGVKLKPVETATTVRVHDGEMLNTDGPFADTKEVFGGYFLLEADTLDAALEVAARLPAARLGGSVEVRPVEVQG
jgi:hypothetical protein